MHAVCFQVLDHKQMASILDFIKAIISGMQMVSQNSPFKGDYIEAMKTRGAVKDMVSVVQDTELLVKRAEAALPSTDTTSSNDGTRQRYRRRRMR